MMLSSTVPMVGLFVAAVAAVGENLVVLFPLVGVAIFGCIALALFLAALEGICTAALYRYASVGDAGMMDSRVVEQAFRAK